MWNKIVTQAKLAFWALALVATIGLIIMQAKGLR